MPIPAVLTLCHPHLLRGLGNFQLPLNVGSQRDRRLRAVVHFVATASHSCGSESASASFQVQFPWAGAGVTGHHSCHQIVPPSVVQGVDRAAPQALLALPVSGAAPTLSLYLEEDFCGSAVPAGFESCFRSCLVTSWLAAQGQRQCSGNRSRQGPGATLSSEPWPQHRPRTLTCLFDSDGEAVVVGAALGFDRHVPRGVTCSQRRHRASS